MIPFPYLECRTIGHAWDQIPSTTTPSFGVYMWFRCTRCTTIRKDIINRFNGSLLARSYDKPDDYAQIGLPSRADLRVQLLSAQGKRRRHAG